jgi:hypothetical protein
MRKSTRILALVGVIVVVVVCALPTVVSAQSAIGIFCNGTGGTEFNQNWNLERNGTGDPGKKFLNYYYTFSDNPTGKYIFNFSSFWRFKFFSYTRGTANEKWNLTHTEENPRQVTGRDGRPFSVVRFEMDAPRSRPTQVLVQITANPYDPAFMMSATIVSSNCTQGPGAPPPGVGCKWVDSMLGQPITPYCTCNGVVVANSRCGRP